MQQVESRSYIDIRAGYEVSVDVSRQTVEVRVKHATAPSWIMKDGSAAMPSIGEYLDSIFELIAELIGEAADALGDHAPDARIVPQNAGHSLTSINTHLERMLALQGRWAR